MKLKIIYFLVFILAVNFISAQNENKYRNEKISWSIIFPKGFENMDLKKQETQIIITKNKTKNSNQNSDQKDEFESLRFQGLHYNYFLINLEKDNTGKKSILEIVKKRNEDLVENFKISRPNATYKTEITHQTVDNIDFIKSSLKIDLGNNVFQNFITYTAKIKNYITNFSIFYVVENEETKELSSSFLTSKFEK